jgi:hypothetical protein
MDAFAAAPTEPSARMLAIAADAIAFENLRSADVVKHLNAANEQVPDEVRAMYKPSKRRGRQRLKSSDKRNHGHGAGSGRKSRAGHKSKRAAAQRESVAA